MKIFKRIFQLILLIILILTITISTYVYLQYRDVKKEIESGVIAKNVEKLRNKEHYTKKEDLDEKYLNAVIAAEDHRFYDHGAVDLISILRAINTNVQKKDLVEGGSSITQQLVKNLFYDQKQTISRKVKEVFMAIELEKRYSKDEILEMYVNNSYFGSGYYSIKEASVGYYGKEPKTLTLNEASFLAGVPNAPAIYNPRVNKEKAIQRRKVVLEKMVTHKYITSEVARKVMDEDLIVKESNITN